MTTIPRFDLPTQEPMKFSKNGSWVAYEHAKAIINELVAVLERIPEFALDAIAKWDLVSDIRAAIIKGKEMEL